MSARLAIALLAALAATAFAAPGAAAFGIDSADVYFGDEAGSPAVEAGSHPFSVTTSFSVDSVLNEEGGEEPTDDLRNLQVQLPVGVVGIPAATPRCSGADFADIDITTEPQLPNCSNDSVVGYVKVRSALKALPPSEIKAGAVPLYNLDPALGTVARFGFIVASVPVTVEAELSEEAPYRVVATIRNTSQALLIFGGSVTLWGNPFAHVHDTIRGSCLKGLDNEGNFESNGSCPVSEGLSETALLTLPRACEGPLTSSFAASTWLPNPASAFATSTTHDDGEPPTPVGFQGCGELGYEPPPALGLGVSSAAGESPAGLDFSFDVEDGGFADPGARAHSDLKRIVATLPPGVTVNPSAANGLAGCTTAQLAAEKVDSPPGAGCPQAAKIGTVAVSSPLVDQPLSGPLFVAQPDNPATPAHGAENPFDSFLAVYMVLRNKDLGVIVKNAGRVDADPVTGQLTTTFDAVPQVPFDHLEAHFRKGARAPLATPGQCGTYVATAVETPWANPGEPMTQTAAFHVASGPNGSPCPTGPAGLAPGFEAGTAGNRAGDSSPFNLRLTRNDGEGELTGISLAMPRGLTGSLAGVSKCSEAQIAAARAKTGLQELAAPSCPANSAVGHVQAGAGVGPALTWVGGTVYLAGPYNGAPLSLVVVTPAVAGPFDVGDVVLRQALMVDESTAQVSVDPARSDPIPRILKGVPLRLRDLRVSIDRPGFILNPTGCREKQIVGGATGGGTFLGPAAATDARLVVRYQASECGRLRFRPRVAVRLKGATKRTGHPQLRVALKPRAGESNVNRTAAILPASQFIDPLRIGNVCTRDQFAAHACPRESVLGRARAFTPLLDEPLEGPVYFRSNGGARDLPDVVADLRGEIHIVLVGFVDSVGRKGSEVTRVRTIFQGVPDAPVSKFVIRLKGGKKGFLQNSESLCRRPQRAVFKLKAQNSRRKTLRQRIKTDCRRKASRTRKRHSRTD